MELTLARHGQSVSNVTGRWQGQGDAQLSDLGREQAAALAVRLGPLPFDRIVSSDLSRAADTAAAMGRPMTTNPVWREIDLGAWEGLTRAEVHQRFPEEIAGLQAGEDVAVGGGERWSDLERRLRGGLDQLLVEARDERVLLVAHGGVIITLLSSLMGVATLRPRRLGKLGNTSLSSVSIGSGPAILRRYNDVAHAPSARTDHLERQRGRPMDDLQVETAEQGAELSARVHERAFAGADHPAVLAPLQPGRTGTLLRVAGSVTLHDWNVGPGPSL
jgi:broad specificity phosphatase PhoE